MRCSYSSISDLVFLFLGCIKEDAIDYFGQDIPGGKKKTANSQECADFSSSIPGGLFWTWRSDTETCFVKSSNSGRKADGHAVSGNRKCGVTGRKTYIFRNASISSTPTTVRQCIKVALVGQWSCYILLGLASLLSWTWTPSYYLSDLDLEENPSVGALMHIWKQFKNCYRKACQLSLHCWTEYSKNMKKKNKNNTLEHTSWFLACCYL